MRLYAVPASVCNLDRTMGIRRTTTDAEIARAVRAAVERADKLTTSALQRMGEQAVTRTRDRSAAESWTDRTGNLRSSVGYLLVKNGVEAGASAFNTVAGGSEGSDTGRRYALQVVAEHPSDYTLAVVAGMDYAQYVESRGRDVLASTVLWAEKELPRVAAKLKNHVLND